ncbi:MAG: hypothetical protein ACMXX9_02045 [Candidatus Woesearchaeota archaeon]
MDFFKKYTIKGKIEQELKTRFKDINLERAVNLHVDAVKLTSKKDVDFFLRLYEEDTKEYLTKTPKNVVSLKQVNSGVPRTYIDNMHGFDIEKKDVLAGFDGLAQGFKKTDHVGVFAQEITSINCDYVKKFPSLAYEFGNVVPMLYERLSKSNATNFLEEVEQLDFEVVKDILHNPLSLIDELKTEEIHSYLQKYNSKFKEVKESKKEAFKNKFLYELFELKEQVIKKRKVNLSNLYEFLEQELVDY